MNLDQLDLFKLLRLSHLKDEEKTAYLQKLVTLVLTDIMATDLPVFMNPEDIEKFNQLSDQEETKEEAMVLLKSKVPDFDDLLKTRLLELKKDLVRSNILERLELDKRNGDKGKAALEKTLSAIDADDWSTVDSLIP